MKKILVMILVVMVLLTTILPALPVFALSGGPSSWAQKEVQVMINKGLVPKNLQSNYQSPITREEFTQLVIPLVEQMIGREIPVVTPNFSDTSSIIVNKANSASIVSGVGNNKFNPKGLITREQIAIMFVNALNVIEIMSNNEGSSISYSYKNSGISDFKNVSDWAKGHVTVAFNNKILNGVSSDAIVFAPKNNATREQAILISYNVLMNLQNPNHVKTINSIANGQTAMNLKQAVYLGSGKSSIGIDLMTLFGKPKSEVVKLFGNSDGESVDVWGNKIEIHLTHAVQFIYNDKDIVIGASSYWLKGNKAFTGKIGVFNDEFTIDYVKKNLKGTFIESEEYQVIFFLPELGDGYYGELLWDYETKEFIDVMVMKGDYTFK